MTTKRYTWKEEYATNGELFWKDLRENERKYADKYTEPVEDDPVLDENYEEPVNESKEATFEEKRKAYIRSLLGANRND